MARVKLIEKENAHPMVKELYEKNIATSGRVINLWKAMGHLPYTGLNYQRMGNSLLKGEGLPANLRELAVLRVGHLTRCKYEFAQHTPIGLRAGLRQKQIDEIGQWKMSKEFTDVERAVLAYADEVEVNIQVKDETFNNLRKYLSEAQVVELTSAIGYYGMTCRLLESLQIDIEK